VHPVNDCLLKSTGTPAKVYLDVALMAKGQMGQGLGMVEEGQQTFLQEQRKAMYGISE